MKVNKYIYVLIYFLLSVGGFAQSRTYKFSSVYDSYYGIKMYDKYNYALGADSIRNYKGHAVKGWITDYYDSGKTMHRGYYIDGQVKIYTNYFENGAVEREFRYLDDYHFHMIIFYPNGKKRSEVNYAGKSPRRWEDYYSNGNLEFLEEFEKNLEHHIVRIYGYENGNIDNTLELKNKKKYIYSLKYFYENGQPKEEGEVYFDKNTLDYSKLGKWILYDEQGKPVKEEEYVGNEKISEKPLN
jgi:antitoxin component YwqK of YwqJK toxin-antitoxin module